MSPADRQKLLADVKLMDELASIVLNAPTSLKPGQEAQVTVTVKGGHGVVGVFLVDTDLRFQARPLQGDGWVIVAAPKVWGGDGNEQTKWVDSRAPGLRKNLNSVVIFDQKSDLAAKKLAEGKVVWTVKAPQEPGTYSITAVFHFGSERASSVGTVTTPTGQVLPRGGPGGPSARIMFAKPVTVTVRQPERERRGSGDPPSAAPLPGVVGDRCRRSPPVWSTVPHCTRRERAGQPVLRLLPPPRREIRPTDRGHRPRPGGIPSPAQGGRRLHRLSRRRRREDAPRGLGGRGLRHPPVPHGRLRGTDAHAAPAPRCRVSTVPHADPRRARGRRGHCCRRSRDGGTRRHLLPRDQRARDGEDRLRALPHLAYDGQRRRKPFHREGAGPGGLPRVPQGALIREPGPRASGQRAEDEREHDERDAEPAPAARAQGRREADAEVEGREAEIEVRER